MIGDNFLADLRQLLSIYRLMYFSYCTWYFITHLCIVLGMCLFLNAGYNRCNCLSPPFSFAQCYGQFGELSWKNQKLLKAVRPSEMQLTESVRRTYCTAVDFTATSSAVEMINRFINLKLTNISNFNYEFTLLNTSHLIQGGLKKYKRQIVFISSQNIDNF